MIPLSTTLSTKNYQLRIPDESDFEMIFSATRYPDFNQGMPWDPPANRKELAAPLARSLARWKDGTDYNFTITAVGASPERLGRISIRQTEVVGIWNVGFWTHPSQQGRGVMTEALAAIINFGFNQLAAQSITACYAIWNKGSEKVLLNNGFTFAAHLEQGFLKKGQWVAENKFELTKERWQSNAKLATCSFCKVIQNNKQRIYEDEHFAVLLDIDPIAIGHVLICPKEHYTDFHELPDELARGLISLAKQYLGVMQKLFAPQGYSMMLNAGAFNDLKHCHLHLFPRTSAEAFAWTYNEDKLHPDAANFAVLKQLIQGNF